MIVRCIGLSMMLFLPFAAKADCLITWDPNPPEEAVTHYIVTHSTHGDGPALTGGEQVTTDFLGWACPDATATVTVSAVNSAGRGAASSPIPLLYLPSIVGGVSVSRP